MLIKIGNSWFNPAGVALMNDPDVEVKNGEIVRRIERTKIIGSGWAMHVNDTPDAVAAEINHQIKGHGDAE